MLLERALVGKKDLNLKLNHAIGLETNKPGFPLRASPAVSFARK